MVTLGVSGLGEHERILSQRHPRCRDTGGTFVGVVAMLLTVPALDVVVCQTVCPGDQFTLLSKRHGACFGVQSGLALRVSNPVVRWGIGRRLVHYRHALGGHYVGGILIPSHGVLICKVCDECAILGSV